MNKTKISTQIRRMLNLIAPPDILPVGTLPTRCGISSEIKGARRERRFRTRAGEPVATRAIVYESEDLIIYTMSILIARIEYIIQYIGLSGNMRQRRVSLGAPRFCPQRPLARDRAQGVRADDAPCVRSCRKNALKRLKALSRAQNCTPPPKRPRRSRFHVKPLGSA